MQFCPLFREWVEADPESALAYLRQMPRGNEYGEGVGLMLGRVQLSDPERAVSLAAELVTRHEEMHLYNQLFSALAESNPSTAVRLVDGVPEGTAHRNAIRALASTWSQTDMESAFNWAINLPQASDSQMAAESVLLILAAKDPTLATDRARQYLRGEALQAVVEQATTRLIAKSSHRAPD